MRRTPRRTTLSGRRFQGFTGIVRRGSKLTEATARKESWLHEALRIVEAKGGDEWDRNYMRTMYRHMNSHGEWWAGRERRAHLLPPVNDPQGRGRPNWRGHVSLETLDKREEKYGEWGILGPKPQGRTNGKLLGKDDYLPKQVFASPEGFRARGIKVLRSAGSLMLRALQRVGFFNSGGFRRSKSQSVISGKNPARGGLGILEEVLSRFRKKRRGGRVWQVPCPCPGHGKGQGDRHPSLSLSETADGKLLWHCHAGCPAEVVGFFVLGRPVRPSRRQEALLKQLPPLSPGGDW